jgi:hypothetical protein
LNWHKNPKQFRRGELRDYDALNIPILDILKQNRARLNSALDQINTTYSNLFEENARLQIALRKVIIQGRLDKNDAAILLEIDRLEKERLRLLAEAEAKRLEAIRIAEEQRLAEEAAIAAAAAADAQRQREIQAQLAREEADRQRREQEANNAVALLAACFFFGHCRL